MEKHTKYLLILSTLFLVTFLGIGILLTNFVQTLSDDSVLSDSTTAPKPIAPTYLVTKVIDGDTIQIEGGQKVRYIGVDTPETVDPNRPNGCFGKEASEKNKNLVLGKKVRLEKDVSETDRYGRLLRYVYVDEVFVNDALVRQGYAKVSTYPPDVKFSSKFLESERLAKAEKKGLWSEKCTNLAE